MPVSTAPGSNGSSHEVSITRIFQAPRELVFEAFCDAEQAKQWIGPEAFVAIYMEQDVRPGGKWRACLHQVAAWNERDYPDLWMGGTFQEVAPPERLVYTFAWEGQGQPTQETVITILFSEVTPDTTRMDFHQALLDSEFQRDDHRNGWNSGFARLSKFLLARATAVT